MSNVRHILGDLLCIIQLSSWQHCEVKVLFWGYATYISILCYLSSNLISLTYKGICSFNKLSKISLKNYNYYYFGRYL
jgi:hypothetical protein